VRSLRNALPRAAAFCALAIAGICFAATPKHAAKKPQSRPAQTQTAPAPSQPVQTDQKITVRENYYLDLPGMDLSTLTPKQRQRFLERVNKEFCTCGCPNDTIARCLVNDPKCPTVRGLAEKILSDVKAGT